MDGKNETSYYLNRQNQFVIENYNHSKPFSSFLPAISGLYGKPMWVFYVNRGQGIATMGVNNKDYSILEFLPANKAYRYTSLQGFRTFLKIRDVENDTVTCYEPFQNLHSDDRQIAQRMVITSYDLRLEEINYELGIKIDVMYCTLPGEKFSGLIRKVDIENISERNLELEVLDGLPVIIPYYLINNDMKNESNLRQAWMGVEHYDTLPFYKIKAMPNDTSETLLIEGGNFYLNFDFHTGAKAALTRTIVEPALVFGHVTDLSYPDNFFKDGFDIPVKQVDVGVTPCGFGYKKIALKKGAKDTTFTLAGTSMNYLKLEEFVKDNLTQEYIQAKITENRDLLEGLKQPIFTSSSSREFDLYCGQSFLDNLLRGGCPIPLGNGKHVFYVYSRKHGDLEREYNFFQIDATNFSQGNSNFRDVNQNRRNDVSFFPFIGNTNIKTFFNLLQLDGFNPLVLKGSRFAITDPQMLQKLIEEFVDEKDRKRLAEYFTKPFTPGGLAGFLEAYEIQLLKADSNIFLNAVIENSIQEELAIFQEGYWVDHWTYNNDLLEQYRGIFPDKFIELLFHKNEFTYYDNDEIVLPREEKYVLTANGVRQFGSVKKINEKEKLIKVRKADTNKVRINYGKGAVYKGSLISKMICLLVNKISSLDPEGVGIEMEADKPGWCDALNGLPGILGSSINESSEVKRLALILLDTVELQKVDKNMKIKLPEEVGRFFSQIYELLLRDISDFDYWDASCCIKEAYRKETFFGLSGREVEISVAALIGFLHSTVGKIDRGLEKAFDKSSGIFYTYFINEAVEYKPVTDAKGNPIKNGAGYPCEKPLKFKQRPIPYFLEGPVHVLRMEKDIKKAKSMHEAIRKSGLYDEKLGMYKVNDNIMEETKEIGRQNIFPRGWLENEAVFLHMEYKYLLELLRCGLHEEFFDDMKKTLVPFLDPKVYGRSILENSSFIASSVHPDEKVHGTGFVSRLTGASAEFLSMWLIMTAGEKPFYLDENNALCLQFKPVLPGWLFKDDPENTFAFNFLGGIPVVYHNAERKDTFGKASAKVERIIIHKHSGKIVIQGCVIRMPYAKMVRDGQVKGIDIFLE